MKRQPTNLRGSTLVIAMSVTALVAILVGVAFTSTTQNGRFMRRSQDLTRVVGAADGALEYVFASWKALVRTNGLRPPSNSQLTIAAPTASMHSGFGSSGVAFSSFSVANTNPWGETKDSSGATITNPVSAKLASVPGHPGWAGVASFCKARVTAQAPSRGGPINVEVARNFQITGIPLFQAAIFFEHDIELHPGALMIINGLVHTNNSLWLATSNPNRLQFLSNVSYVSSFNQSYKPLTTFGGGSTGAVSPNPPLWADGLPATTSTSMGWQLQKTTRMEPFGTEPTALFNTTDANPNNDGPREVIEPPVAASSDPEVIAAMRFYNQASVRVTIDRTKPVADPNRIVIRNGSGAALPALTDSAIRGALNVSATTIYDWREATNVSLTNVDMKKLDTALGGMGASFNGVLYVHDATPTGKNAIRLQNGAVLNRDLSIASNNGVYIQGDYNTGGVNAAGTHDPTLVPSNNGGNPSGTDSSIASGYTKRATAVMADAVMILSNSWLDANSTKAVSGRVASHTTVNTAILSGIVPTNYENSGVYSGGPHNFPRFLESWSAMDLTYLGSMVQTYNSQQFDGIFETSNIYNPPGRKWTFDTSFLTKQPPGTLQSLEFSRGRWERLTGL